MDRTAIQRLSSPRLALKRMERYVPSLTVGRFVCVDGEGNGVDGTQMVKRV